MAEEQTESAPAVWYLCRCCRFSGGGQHTPGPGQWSRGTTRRSSDCGSALSHSRPQIALVIQSVHKWKYGDTGLGLGLKESNFLCCLSAGLVYLKGAMCNITDKCSRWMHRSKVTLKLIVFICTVMDQQSPLHTEREIDLDGDACWRSRMCRGVEVDNKLNTSR